MGDELKLTVNAALSGATVWGPAGISGSMELGAFVEIVAEELGVDKVQVVLSNGDDKLSGVTLCDAGVKDGSTLVATVKTSDFDPDIIATILESVPGEKRQGLTNEQVGKIQTKYGFIFPPDLRAFLQVGIPEHFHNWHELASDDVKVDLQNPDPKDTASQAIKIHAMPAFNCPEVHEMLECCDHDELEKRRTKHPMVPIMGCCFMPSVPHEPGLPVAHMRNACFDVCVAPNFWRFICGDGLPVERKADARLVPEAWKAKQILAKDLPFWEPFLDN